VAAQILKKKVGREKKIMMAVMGSNPRSDFLTSLRFFDVAQIF
jgi:hypothetical protein